MVENCELLSLSISLSSLFSFLFGLPVMFAFDHELTFFPWRKDIYSGFGLLASILLVEMNSNKAI